MDKYREAVDLASSGRLEEAKIVFEEILLEGHLDGRTYLVRY